MTFDKGMAVDIHMNGYRDGVHVVESIQPTMSGNEYLFMVCGLRWVNADYASPSSKPVNCIVCLVEAHGATP